MLIRIKNPQLIEKALLREYNGDVKALAEACYKTRQNIYNLLWKIRTGHRVNSTTLKPVLDALGVSYDELETD